MIVIFRILSYLSLIIFFTGCNYGKTMFVKHNFNQFEKIQQNKDKATIYFINHYSKWEAIRKDYAFFVSKEKNGIRASDIKAIIKETQYVKFEINEGKYTVAVATISNGIKPLFGDRAITGHFYFFKKNKTYFFKAKTKTDFKFWMNLLFQPSFYAGSNGIIPIPTNIEDPYIELKKIKKDEAILKIKELHNLSTIFGRRFYPLNGTVYK